MKATFETTDENEIKRIAKANDMTDFIFELVKNGWRDFKNTDYDYQPAWDKINRLLEQHNIDIDDLAG